MNSKKYNSTASMTLAPSVQRLTLMTSSGVTLSEPTERTSKLTFVSPFVLHDDITESSHIKPPSKCYTASGQRKEIIALHHVWVFSPFITD